MHIDLMVKQKGGGAVVFFENDDFYASVGSMTCVSFKKFNLDIKADEDSELTDFCEKLAEDPNYASQFQEDVIKLIKFDYTMLVELIEEQKNFSFQEGQNDIKNRFRELMEY